MTFPALVVIPVLSWRSLTLSYRRVRVYRHHDQVPMSYLNPVVQLNLATGIDTDVLQSFPCNIVRLSARLQSLQNGRLVDSSRGICVQRAIRAISEWRAASDSYVLEAVDEIEHLVPRDFWVFLLQFKGLHGRMRWV